MSGRMLMLMLASFLLRVDWYPATGSSSSHLLRSCELLLLLLLHPNVILDASHEPRLAIIGRSLHRTMNAGSDRLAIGSSPAMTRHTRDVDDEK